MNKIEALKRMAELKKTIREAVEELEQLKTETFGSARRGRVGQMVKVTYKDGTSNVFVSIASAIRALRAKLGRFSDRRGTRFDIYKLAGRLGATAQVELSAGELDRYMETGEEDV